MMRLVEDFGAVADGVTNNAVALQRAIDSCHADGGGVVALTRGVYLSGSIELKSGVELHVERGSMLRSTGKWSDITHRLPVAAKSSNDLMSIPEYGAIVFAKDAHDIAITGAGTIDGMGSQYILEDLGVIYRMDSARPYLLFFIDCTAVQLRDIHLKDAPLWTVRFTGCEEVAVNAVRVTGDMKLPNGDGLDLDRCRDVRVSDCYIATPDDAIALHSTSEFSDSGICQAITVSNCVLQSRSSGIVVGALSADTIRDIVFEGCVIKTSHRGLSINMGQEGHYENITFSNMVVEAELNPENYWGRGEPIYVSAMPWLEDVGTVQNIRFINILARGENGVFVEGHHPGLIEDVLFDNVRIEIDKWTEYKGGTYDRRPYSGTDPLFSHQTNGFYVSNASNVTIRNCKVVWGEARQDYWGHAVEAHAAPNLKVENLDGVASRPDLQAVVTD